MDGAVESNDGSLKKIAGDILLILYFLQRQHGYCDGGIISIDRKMDNPEALEKSTLGAKLIKNGRSVADVYNALRYLQEKDFVSLSENNDNQTFNIFDLRVSAGGIDIIEGIVRGPEERQQFYITFNIKLTDSINIETLIKNEIGSLFKASVI